jgi:hypothetical protein
MPAPHARRPLRAVATLATAALLSGCWGGSTGDAEPAAPAASPPSAEPEAPRSFEVDTRVVGVDGGLRPADRRRVAAGVGRLVQRYLDAAFADRERGRAAFPGFIPTARRLAVEDRRAVSSAGLGAGSVVPGRASASVTVLAPGGRLVGATARVVARMRLEGGERPTGVVLRGRLLLTPTEDGWRVFGYDLSRAGAPVAGGER